MALLLPKLRRHFAEFLNHSSLDRLGILYLTTCVGLGYGPQQHSLEAFLDSMGSPSSPQSATHHLSPFTTPRIYLGDQATGLHHDNHRVAELPSCVTPSLAYYQIGSHAPPQTTLPKERRWVRMVSITSLGMDALSRAREYQPVVHRLRLTASP